MARQQHQYEQRDPRQAQQPQQYVAQGVDGEGQPVPPFNVTDHYEVYDVIGEGAYGIVV